MISMPLTYPSSAEFWLQGTHKDLYCSQFHTELCEFPSDYQFKAVTADAVDAMSILGLSAPLHIDVKHARNLRSRKNLVTRMNNMKYSPESYVHLRKPGYDFYIPRPELCFLQAAKTLKITDLIILGYDLCSMYAQNNFDKEYFTPITTAEKIKEYLDLNPGVRGVKKARRAIKYVIDNSNSPIETKLSILFSLPKSMGGYGISRPKMNDEIRLDNQGALLCGYKAIHADISWHEKKVAVEYNSDQYHLNSKTYSDDMNRLIALNLQGFSSIVFTAQDLRSFSQFDTKVRILMDMLEIKFDDEKLKSLVHERSELYKQLFKNNNLPTDKTLPYNYYEDYSSFPIIEEPSLF